MKRIAMALCLFVVCVAGCGGNSEMTDQQVAEQRASMKEWATWAAGVARDHDLAYHLSIDVRGRGSVGAMQDFYVDTGVSGRITMFGNAGAARQPVNTEPKD